MKIDKESLKKFAIGAGKIFIFGSLTLLTMKFKTENQHIYYVERTDCEDYNDAVDAIIESDMLDRYKNDALGMVKRNMDKEYYRAVASIARGDALDSYKVSMIKNLYNNEARA